MSKVKGFGSADMVTTYRCILVIESQWMPICLGHGDDFAVMLRHRLILIEGPVQFIPARFGLFPGGESTFNDLGLAIALISPADVKVHSCSPLGIIVTG
jgi:hypothetical protein